MYIHQMFLYPGEYFYSMTYLVWEIGEIPITVLLIQLYENQSKINVLNRFWNLILFEANIVLIKLLL